MSGLGRYSKSITALVGAVLTWTGAAYVPDGHVTRAEWFGLAVALATAVGVYAVTNNDPAPAPAPNPAPLGKPVPLVTPTAASVQDGGPVMRKPVYRVPKGSRGAGEFTVGTETVPGSKMEG